MNARLKARFITANKTQREVAKKLEIPETRLSDFVQEVRNPTEAQKELIARELGCEVGEIF